jgi:hypothetical protein
MKTAILSRRRALRGAVAWTAALPAAVWLFSRAGLASPLPPIVVWKDPDCGCCERWVQHMRKAGFSVTVRASASMAAIKEARGVPNGIEACHTAVVDGYVVEGHVPAHDVMRLLGERPTAKGLAVPGMPASAPGMDQPGQPYTVMLFGAPSGDRPYAQHTGTEDADAL